jgi:hypothetical protein
MKIYAKHFRMCQAIKGSNHGTGPIYFFFRLKGFMKEAPRPFLSFKLPLVTMKMIIMLYLERLRNEKKQKIKKNCACLSLLHPPEALHNS